MKYNNKTIDRYVLIDRKSGEIFQYSQTLWDYSWYLVFILGIMAGYCLAQCF